MARVIPCEAKRLGQAQKGPFSLQAAQGSGGATPPPLLLQAWLERRALRCYPTARLRRRSVARIWAARGSRRNGAGHGQQGALQPCEDVGKIAQGEWWDS